MPRNMSYVQQQRRDGITEVVLNRPKVNAMNSALMTELTHTFAALASDETVKGVLLRGEGKCLSAGLDLREVAQLDSASLGQFLDLFDAAYTRLFTFPKPMAVAVTGHAIAGGLVLALCADYVALGKGRYQHGLTELAVGVPFPVVALEIVKHGVQGRGRRTLMYGAGTHTPEQLYEWGIGDSLDDTPIDSARTWLEAVCARPLNTFRLVKASDRRAAQQCMAAQTLAQRRRLVAAMLEARAAVAE